MFRVFLIFAGGLLAACSSKHQPARLAEYQPREGDLIFQSLPRNPLVVTIEGSTGSPFSHCGFVVNIDGQWKVLEAIGPVMETPLSVWIARGRDNAYVAYRLREPLQARIPQIITAARRYMGRPYDIRYDMDDAAIYCSELIWKATRDATGTELGKIQRFGDLNWQPYEKTVRETQNGELPLERKMVTPRSLTEDARLAEVFRFRM